MDREQLRQTLLEILEQETWEKPEQFGDNVNIRTGLKLDSVDLLSVALRAESKLGVALDSRDFERITTVGHLLDALQSKLALAENKRAA
jgi:acyl carrier protein